MDQQVGAFFYLFCLRLSIEEKKKKEEWMNKQMNILDLRARKEG